MCLFFFFQAEDGIRDGHVTGVQTCALPIWIIYVVVFAYTEMIPNGGVAASSELPEDLVSELTELMDGYAESSDEAASVMYDLVGLSDWTADTEEEQSARYGAVLAQSSEQAPGAAMTDAASTTHPD